MSVLGATVAATGHLSRTHPLAKLGASLVVAVALLLSIDPVSAGVALGLELCALPQFGLGPRAVVVRTLPLLVAAPLAGLTTVLYGADSGATLLDVGIVSVTSGSVLLGLAIALRVLAIGIPGVLLLATTDPTDLADGLAQVLRLPARFVLGGLAGLRIAGLLVDDWRALSLARRARGVGDGGGPFGALRRLGSQVFSLLVLAVRRGSRLATAMEARGFGAPVARTWARPSRLQPADALPIVGALGIVALAIAAAVAVGTWSFVFA
jgi:energy-coupling factor transport system permease protein